MQTETILPDPGDFAPVVAPPAPRPDPRLVLVAGLLQFATGVSADLVIDVRHRGRAATRVRHIAMYLFSTVYGEAAHRTAALFGRDRSTVLHALRRIEEDRSNPAFDAWLGGLETALFAAPRGGRA